MNERIKYPDPVLGAQIEFALGHGLESNPYSKQYETWKHIDFDFEICRLQSEEFKQDRSMQNNPVIKE